VIFPFVLQVHCAGGVSRSSALVAAYLMRAESMSLADALQHIRTCHPAAAPNSGTVPASLIIGFSEVDDFFFVSRLYQTAYGSGAGTRSRLPAPTFFSGASFFLQLFVSLFQCDLCFNSIESRHQQKKK
jgi:hypothetical protein